MFGATKKELQAIHDTLAEIRSDVKELRGRHFASLLTMVTVVIGIAIAAVFL